MTQVTTTPTFTKNQQAVVTDLLACLDDEDLHDVTLRSTDGVAVPACRFVLAARSKVLRRMLYGNFREATACEVDLDYNARTLQGVVRYCTHNTVDNETDDPDESTVRRLVHLAKAADYLEIPGLVKDAHSLVNRMVHERPLLACAVYDEADESSALFSMACRMIRGRPYVALQQFGTSEEDGGVECLKSDRIVELMKDTEIEAGELFMFEMLKRWVDQHDEDCREQALEVAQECGKYFRLHYIEPTELLSTVQKSGLFPANLIVEAILRQALKASQSRVWTIACRGKDTKEDRVLVEGCGNPEVNGVYYRIKGLHKGDVYSKHEISCGQLLVYTLSCSQKDDTIESRIFASKVLTHRAIQTMLLAQQVTAPVFQPLLQILQVELPTHNPHDASPLAKMCKIELSDGDFSVSGTMAEELTKLVEEEQIQQFSLLKVLACDKYEYDGKQHLHVTEVSFVSAHPGRRLGSPVDVSDKKEKLGSENKNNDDGLQKFYSCYYPRDQQAKDTKIPRTGWGIEERGVEPAPRCTWIPATTKRFGDISNASSFDNDEKDQ